MTYLRHFVASLREGQQEYSRLASALTDERLRLRTISKSGHSAGLWVTVSGSRYASHQFSLCGKGQGRC